MFARAVSSLGSAGTRVALVWLVISRPDGGGMLGVVLVAFTAPQFGIGLLAGVLADRMSRKALVVASDSIAAAAMFLLWLLDSASALPIGALIGLAVIIGGCAAALGPGVGSMMPQLVPREQLGRANSLYVAGNQLAAVLGPAAAGFIVVAAGPGVWFAADGVTSALAAIVFSLVGEWRGPVRGGPAPPGLIQGMRSAVRLVRRTGWLWTGITTGGLANLLAVAPVSVLVPLLIHRQHLGAQDLGWFGTTFAAGTVVGALISPRLRGSHPVRRAAAAVVTGGLIVTAMGRWPSATPLLTLGLALGVLLAVYEVLWTTYEQAEVPDATLGQVFAVDAWLSFGLRTAGLAALSGFTALPAAALTGCGIFLAITVLPLIPFTARSSPGTKEEATKTRS
jgi:MFS family permease